MADEIGLAGVWPMRHKIAWLFLWTTLTFWLGCGQNQNYRINQEDEPIFKAPEPAQPGGGSSATRWPSREGWQAVDLSPVRGTTRHRPQYFHRNGPGGRAWAFRHDRPSPLLADPPSVEAPLLRADADDDFRYGFREVGDLFLAPTQAGVDVGALPLRAVAIERPWAWQSTPAR